MEDRAIRGVPWTLLAFGSTKVITLLTTLVLARLLDPTDFGLMALALLAFGLLGLVRDLGLGSTIVLRQDFDDRALGTVLTLMLITAAIVAAIVVATAPLAAWALDEPRLVEILTALAAVSLFGMVGGFYDNLLQRELEFARRFLGQITQSISFAVVGIGLALAGVGVWSLVLAQIVSMVAYCFTLLAVSPHRLRPRFERSAAREALTTGSGFFAQGALNWIEQNVDYLVVGRLLGTAQLGIYSMAYRLSELTDHGIAEPLARVTFPGFARMRHRGEEVTRPYVGALRLVALLGVPIGAILSGAAEPFTLTIFGENWEDMIEPLAVLGIWAALVPLESTAGWLLSSIGLAGTEARISAVLLVPTIPLVVLAASNGTVYVAWVLLGKCVIGLAARLVVIATRGKIPLLPQVEVLWPVLAAGVLTWSASRGVDQLLSVADLAALAGAVAAGLLVFAGSVMALAPDTYGFVRRQVQRVVRPNVPVVGVDA